MSAFYVSSAVVAATILLIARVTVREIECPAAPARPEGPKDPGIDPWSASQGPSGGFSAAQAVAQHETNLAGMCLYPTRPTTIWARLRCGFRLVALASILGGLVALTGVALAVGVGLVISGMQ